MPIGSIPTMDADSWVTILPTDFPLTFNDSSSKKQTTSTECLSWDFARSIKNFAKLLLIDASISDSVSNALIFLMFVSVKTLRNLSATTPQRALFDPSKGVPKNKTPRVALTIF